MPNSISLGYFIPEKRDRMIFKIIIPLLDRLLGIKKVDQIYKENNLEGLPKEELARKVLEDIFKVQISTPAGFVESIPKTGPLVIASNHPFGCIEGVILAHLLGQIRPDLKILANQALAIIPELRDYFIFTNPLSERDPKNMASLKKSIKHVQDGKAILLFPAGRVAYYQEDKKRISEHSWNKIIGKLAKMQGAQFIPLYIEGKNSPLFYNLGRVYFRFKLLMLVRELINKKNLKVKITTGTPIKAHDFTRKSTAPERAEICRLLSYSQDPQWSEQWPKDPIQSELQPLAEPIAFQEILDEIEQLPKKQHLVESKNFSVFYASQDQVPQTVFEIARLREVTFRSHKEGSGSPIDMDSFDATYTHLFLIDRDKKKVAGAYRFGRTDIILPEFGVKGLYLNQMFSFSEESFNRTEPCLEMGRTFIAPEYQKSIHGLYLLWKGIGAFLSLFPQYRKLYGTVSISKLYDPRSVAIIKEALVQSCPDIRPRKDFTFKAHEEIIDYAKESSLRNYLGPFLKSIESDGKDIPILLKHYMSLGSKFHSLGLDESFNDTPGLLLSVDLPNIPEKISKLYFGEKWDEFISYKS